VVVVRTVFFGRVMSEYEMLRSSMVRAYNNPYAINSSYLFVLFEPKVMASLHSSRV
jgi:hypothetical protein